jgi:alanyl-tRNA synthetase
MNPDLYGPDLTLAELVPVLVQGMGDHFTEIRERQQHIETVIRAEEESFRKTLDRGIALFEEVSTGGEVSGEDAFKLYDTYGFPLDLTQQMARERGIEVDVEGFHREMEKAKERSRAGSAFKLEGGEFQVLSEGPHSRFVGYDTLEATTELRAVKSLTPGEGEDEAPHKVAVVLGEATPFYAEAGGQVADHGVIRGEGLLLRVVDVRQEGDRRLHIAEVVERPEGEWPVQVAAEVDPERRGRILPHHTTTHLLQAALRRRLGEHVTQAGSRVGPDSMTFDFTHPEKVEEEVLREVEEEVNVRIREDHPVTARVMKIEEAKASGAMALFGEKYEEEVRVVSIGREGEVSRELCGGTHMHRTGQAGLFRIEAESAVSAGVRRVECTAGEAAWERAAAEREAYHRVQDLIGSRGSDPAEKLEKFFAERKALEKEVERLKRAALEGAVDFLADWGEEIEVAGEPALLVAGVYEVAGDRDALQAAGDKIVQELKKAGREGIGIVGNELDGTFMFVAVVSEGLVKRGVSAGRLVGHVARAAGGGGGGKPSFATAGSKQLDKAQTVLRDRPQVRRLVQEYLQSLEG